MEAIATPACGSSTTGARTSAPVSPGGLTTTSGIAPPLSAPDTVTPTAYSVVLTTVTVGSGHPFTLPAHNKFRKDALGSHISLLIRIDQPVAHAGLGHK